jgi:hypothetical protein
MTKTGPNQARGPGPGPVQSRPNPGPAGREPSFGLVTVFEFIVIIISCFVIFSKWEILISKLFN